MPLYVLIAVEREKVLKEKVLTKAARFRCRAPLLILMGKKSEKLPKEKIRARFQKYFGFVFSLPTADETLGARKKQFGRERPSEHVWAAKPHKRRGRSRPN